MLLSTQCRRRRPHIISWRLPTMICSASSVRLRTLSAHCWASRPARLNAVLWTRRPFLSTRLTQECLFRFFRTDRTCCRPRCHWLPHITRQMSPGQHFIRNLHSPAAQVGWIHSEKQCRILERGCFQLPHHLHSQSSTAENLFPISACPRMLNRLLC